MASTLKRFSSRIYPGGWSNRLSNGLRAPGGFWGVYSCGAL